jgi:hypothetical protein
MKMASVANKKVVGLDLVRICGRGVAKRLADSEQQLASGLVWKEHLCELDRVASRVTFPAGQQLWRKGEGSGAGEVAACTITAAHEFMAGHAIAGRLTDQASSVTIKTTPDDRLTITGTIVKVQAQARCDHGHAEQ